MAAGVSGGHCSIEHNSVSRLFSGDSKKRPDGASGRFFVCVSVLLAET